MQVYKVLPLSVFLKLDIIAASHYHKRKPRQKAICWLTDTVFIIFLFENHIDSKLFVIKLIKMSGLIRPRTGKRFFGNKYRLFSGRSRGIRESSERTDSAEPPARSR